MPEERDEENLKKETGRSQCGGCCTRISNLAVTVGSTHAIENVNLHFHCGEFTVITGPNGAGKSTLLKAIAGEIPYTGEILFRRFDTNEKMKPKIGYVPQNMPFDPGAPLTVEDLFALCLSSRPRWLFRSRSVRKTALESLGTVEASHLLSRKLGCLSGGELQRVFLSLALNPRPDILLLDEPVSGVDAAGLNLFYAMISELRAKYDLSIVMISHDFHLSARYADRIVFLNKTVLCSGTPAEALKNESVNSFFGAADSRTPGGYGGISHHCKSGNPPPAASRTRRINEAGENTRGKDHN
ncbi:MAG: metal ABC transporter ATP-binding protein [Chitinispirillales bacterium]|jgi:zinc transport system ATP-binding protein|nr:metal ABC transporter ATP-binding protein [Chitinispirillales bacterium]